VSIQLTIPRTHVLAKWASDPEVEGDLEKQWKALGAEERAVHLVSVAYFLSSDNLNDPQAETEAMVRY
jgi:hypothetical protein